MSEPEGIDSFCEYYDFSELTNLSDFGANTENATTVPSSEEHNCASGTTSAALPEDVRDVLISADEVDVKEEIVDALAALDEPVVEYMSYGNDQISLESDPLEISPKDVKVEPPEICDTGSSELVVPENVQRRPELCNGAIEGETKQYRKLSREFGGYSVDDVQARIKLKASPEADANSVVKNLQGLKSHGGTKYGDKLKVLLAADDELLLKCNNNTDIGETVKTETHSPTRENLKPFNQDNIEDKSKQISGGQRNINLRVKLLVFCCTMCVYKTCRRNDMKNHCKNRHRGRAAELENIYRNVLWVKKSDYNKILETNRKDAGGWSRQKQRMESVKATVKKSAKYCCFACEYKSDSKYDLEKHLTEKHVEYTTAFHLQQDKNKNGNNKGSQRNVEAVSQEKVDTCSKSRAKKKLQNVKPLQVNNDTLSIKTKEHSRMDGEVISGHKMRTYCCDMCDFMTRWNTNIKRHFGVCHKTDIVKYSIIDVYYCYMCTYHSKHVSVMKRHVKKKHNDADSCQSESEGKVKTTSRDITTRSEGTKVKKTMQNRDTLSASSPASKRKRDGTESSNTQKTVKKPKLNGAKTDVGRSRKKFHCSKCTYETKIEMVMQRHHREVHENVRPFGCTMCGKAFKRKFSLKMHSMICVKKPAVFACSHCPYENGMDSQVKHHIKVKHGGRASIVQNKR